MGDLALFVLCVLAVSAVGYFIAARRGGRGANLVDPGRWDGCLPSLQFRRYRDSDLEQCLEIYRLNESGRFPEGILNRYWRLLADHGAYFLVLEQDGRIVATGGIAHYDANMAILCYGLVHPEFQGRGIGTALLFARLALLPLDPKDQHAISIACVSNSLGFYERFGFRKRGHWEDPAGRRHPMAYLLVNNKSVHAVRELLAKAHIELPLDDCNKIPQIRFSALY
jgi:N-acetylglutamate synthase-like GNAT family acetyltransferase